MTQTATPVVQQIFLITKCDVFADHDVTPALKARSLEHVIRLLLYLLVRNYQNLKTVFVLNVSIKLLHNRIPIL